MKTIKTLKDLQTLTTSNPKVSEPIIQHIEEFFLILSEALGPETSTDEFTLEDHGYLVLLEQGDDLRNLKTVGLKPDQDGLL